MPVRGSRRVALFVGACVTVGLSLLLGRGEPPPRVSAPAPTDAVADREAPARIDSVVPPPPADPPLARAEATADADAGSLDADPDWERALRWSAVDLDAIERAIPDNLYWRMSSPTDDPAVQQWRRDERDRWNRAYGRVLAGHADAGEVRDYYALRERISQDALEFSDHLLADYGEVLPERDLRLLHLAKRLHAARLEEIPRSLAEGLERSGAHARRRAEWLADEATFEAKLADEAAAASDATAAADGARSGL